MWPTLISPFLITGTLCSQSDTICWQSLTKTLHLMWLRCTWLHLTDIQGSGKRREVTACKKLVGQRKRVRVTTSSALSNASVTLNTKWRVSAAPPEAISCIWHMHFPGIFDWLCDFSWKISLRAHVTCQTSPSGGTNAPDTPGCEFTLHILGKYFSREPNYYPGSYMSCRTQSKNRYLK